MRCPFRSLLEFNQEDYFDELTSKPFPIGLSMVIKIFKMIAKGDANIFIHYVHGKKISGNCFF